MHIKAFTLRVSIWDTSSGLGPCQGKNFDVSLTIVSEVTLFTRVGDGNVTTANQLKQVQHESTLPQMINLS